MYNKTRLISITLTIVLVSAAFADNNKNMIKHYDSNPNLATIMPDSLWKGVPVNKNNMYINIENNVLPKFSDLLKWLTTKNPQRNEKKADTWRVETITNSGFLTDTANKFVWLGHSSFFMQINGIRILIDPILTNGFLKRYAGYPETPDAYINIDYVLISHNHRDHADKKSLKIIAKNNARVQILAGLGMNKRVKKWVKGCNIQEAGWYQQYNTDTSKIKIYFLPSQHWSKRGLFDTNKTLWGSFVIQAENITIYWAGDSGHGSHFEKAAELFPNINYCFMPIGAYKPVWFMSPQHITPTEAVNYFNLMRAKNFVPMHYGTFDLADEPLGEPYRTMQQLNAEGKIIGKLIMSKIGESVFFD